MADEDGGPPAEALDTPIQAMVDATNRGDREALLNAFADNATLIDFGRTFAGRAEIARWNDNENIGTHTHIAVTSVARSGLSVTVGIVVTGNRYNGPGSMVFDLGDGHITRLLITA